MGSEGRRRISFAGLLDSLGNRAGSVPPTPPRAFELHTARTHSLAPVFPAAPPPPPGAFEVRTARTRRLAAVLPAIVPAHVRVRPGGRDDVRMHRRRPQAAGGRAQAAPAGGGARPPA